MARRMHLHNMCTRPVPDSMYLHMYTETKCFVFLNVRLAFFSLRGGEIGCRCGVPDKYLQVYASFFGLYVVLRER